MSSSQSSSDPDVYRTWPDGFVVRRMVPDDVKIVQKWFSSFGTICADLLVALETYPRHEDGFYSGYKDGQIIASAIRIPVCEGIYYGSMYFVDEAHRRRGYGGRIRDDVATERVGGAILAIDAHDYMEQTNIRQGYISAGKVNMYVGRPRLDKLPQDGPDINTLKVQDVSFDELIAYDNKSFVRPNSPLRRALLERWVKIDGGQSWAAIDQGGHVIGYGCRRPGVAARTHMIGPLYADSYAIAVSLFRKLCEDIPGDEISLTLFESNSEATTLVRTAEMLPTIHMIRMYRNGTIANDNARVFAITSPDICGF